MVWGQKLPNFAFHKDDLAELAFSLKKDKAAEDSVLAFEKEERLECLISKDDDFKGAEFFYMDGENYKLVKAEFHRENDENFALFHSKITTKSLKIKGLKSTNFKPFKRKHSLMVATRFDLFGGRFMSMLNAMYLAKKSGLKFGFTWDERIPKDMSKDYFVEPENEFFEKSYLKKHSYTKGVCVSYAPVKFSSIKDLMTAGGGGVIQHNWGFECPPNYPLTTKHISDLDEKNYRQSLPKLFHTIKFTPKYQKAFDDAKGVAASLSPFVSLHIRSGDAVYSDIYRRLIFMWGVMARVFPVELAVHFIKENAKHFNVVLFSDDAASLEIIKKAFDKSPLKNRLFISSQLVNQSYEKHQKDFFDFYLMSLSDKIIASQWTSFSTLSAMIGQVAYSNLNQNLDPNKQYEIIEKNFDKLKVNNFQKAVSMAYLYTLAVNLKKDYETKKDILLKAFGFDEDNFAYANKLLEEAFKEKRLDEVEKFCEFFLGKNALYFIQTLFHRYPGDKQSPYANLYEFFKNNASEANPHLAYVAGAICEMQKENDKALNFYQMSLKAKPDKSLFVGAFTRLFYQKFSSFELRLNENLQGTNASLQGLLDKNKEVETMLQKQGYESLRFACEFLKNGLDLAQKDNKKMQKECENARKECEKAKNFKNHLSYKIGEALIKAYKTRWHSGLVRFVFFDAWRVYKEFKAKHP